MYPSPGAAGRKGGAQGLCLAGPALEGGLLPSRAVGRAAAGEASARQPPAGLTAPRPARPAHPPDGGGAVGPQPWAPGGPSGCRGCGVHAGAPPWARDSSGPRPPREAARDTCPTRRRGPGTRFRVLRGPGACVDQARPAPPPRRAPPTPGRRRGRGGRGANGRGGAQAGEPMGAGAGRAGRRREPMGRRGAGRSGCGPMEWRAGARPRR